MKKKLIMLFAFIGIYSFYYAQVYNEDFKTLPVPYGNSSGINYGYAVSIDGSFAVAGAPGYNSNQGKAEVLEYTGSSWDVVAVLTGSNSAANDNFGSSVCIYGDVIIVGAYNNSDNGTNSGMSYIFEKPAGGWADMTETVQIIPSDFDNSDNFGKSVAIYDDLAFVGATGWDNTASNEGAIYVFQKASSTWEDYNYIATLTLSDPSNTDELGNVISVDGNYILAGVSKDDDNGTNAGAAYIFEKPASGWINATETAKLTATDCTGFNYVGISVSVSGNVVVVGSSSSAAYVFVEPGTGWADVTQDAKLETNTIEMYDSFGESVAIDDETIIVGAPSRNYNAISNNGAAYIYKKPVGEWTDAIEDAVLSFSISEEEQCFGNAVDFNGDYIIVGASEYSADQASQGSASFFIKPASGWANSSEDYNKQPIPYLHNSAENCGYNVAAYGNYAVMGAYGYSNNAGAAYVLEYDGTVWNNIARLYPSDSEEDEYFGYSVAIIDDEIIVGAYNDLGASYNGAVYVFKKPVTGWTDMSETAKLSTSDLSSNQKLGFSVDYDGQTIVAGAPGYDYNGAFSGCVYVFEKPEAGWVNTTEDAILYASDSENSDNFGSKVVVKDNIIAVGHYYNDVDGNESGSIYVFDKVSENWEDASETSIITPQNVAANDFFGYALDIDNEVIVAGSNSQIPGNAGYVCVFEKNEDTWTEMALLESSDNTINDKFGISVSIENDLIVVGASENNSTGAAYVFRKPSNGWSDSNEQVKLSISDALTNDYFGTSVDLNNGMVIIGANGLDDNGNESGGAYLFLMPYLLEEANSFSDVCGDETVTFEISAIATNYEWQISDEGGTVFTQIVDDETFSGTTSDSLVINLNSELNNLNFRCKIYGGDNYIMSEAYLVLLEDELPVLNVQNKEIFLDEFGLAYLTAADVVLNASDNCNIADTLLSQSEFNCDDNSTSVDVILVDVSGNTTVLPVTITISDNINPEILCPETINVISDVGQAYYTVQGTEFDPTDIIENCDYNIINNLNSFETLDNAEIPLGTTDVVWSITDNAGNEGTCTSQIIVDEYVSSNLFNSEMISVFPNPANEQFYLNLDNTLLNKNIKVKMYDISGKVVYSFENVVSNSLLIDISDFNSGIYILDVECENQINNFKVIKQ